MNYADIIARAQQIGFSPYANNPAQMQAVVDGLEVSPVYDIAGQTEQSTGEPRQTGYMVSTPLGGTTYRTDIVDANGNLIGSNTHDAGADKYGFQDMAKMAAIALGANALGSALGVPTGAEAAGTTAAGTTAAGAGAAGAGAAGAGATAAGAGALGAAGAGALGGSSMFQYLIPAAASLLGTTLSANAATSAARTTAEQADRAAQLQRESSQEALALQRRMYEEGVARQQPYYQAGVNALAQMQGQTGAMPAAFTGQVDLTRDPGYAFRFSEGLKALDRQAAARGGLISGRALKGAQRYGQEFASQEYGNAYNRALTEYNALRGREAEGYNRLAGLAGVGGTTAQQLTSAGQQYGQQAGNLLSGAATNIGNIMMGQGQTAANAALARGSAYSGGLNQLGYLAGRYYAQPTGGYGQPVQPMGDISGLPSWAIPPGP